MLFDNTDFDYEISLFKIPGNNFLDNNREDKFLTPEEGFMRGNLEKGTFIPYNQYTYFKLKPENERERMLLKLMAYSFAINDLNLYLDLNPNDMAVFDKFKKYAKELNDLEIEYIKKFGPIVVCETDGANFDWIKNPWPWDNLGGSMYV